MSFKSNSSSFHYDRVGWDCSEKGTPALTLPSKLRYFRPIIALCLFLNLTRLIVIYACGIFLLGGGLAACGKVRGRVLKFVYVVYCSRARVHSN